MSHSGPGLEGKMVCVKRFQRIRTNPIMKAPRRPVGYCELAGTVTVHLLACMFMETHADLLAAKGDIRKRRLENGSSFKSHVCHPEK